MEDVSCSWWRGEGTASEDEDSEAVELWYDSEAGVLRFYPIFPEGFALRDDGVGVNWYGDTTTGVVIRLEFSPERARFVAFERGTGKFHSAGVLVPITKPGCPEE